MTFESVTIGATQLIGSQPQANLLFHDRPVRWEVPALAAVGNRDTPFVRNDRPDGGIGASEITWVPVKFAKTFWRLPMCSVQVEIFPRHQKDKRC